MKGGTLPPWFKRPRVITYLTIFLLSTLGIFYGLLTIPPIELSIVHERQPLFMRMSDGSIQNKYTIKAVNKTERDIHAEIMVDGAEGIRLANTEAGEITLQAGKLVPFNLFLRADIENLREENTPIRIVLREGNSGLEVDYESVFIAPVQ